MMRGIKDDTMSGVKDSRLRLAPEYTSSAGVRVQLAQKSFNRGK